MGGPPLGLDWPQVQAIAALRRQELTAEDADILVAMEKAACEVWKARADRETPKGGRDRGKRK